MTINAENYIPCLKQGAKIDIPGDIKTATDLTCLGDTSIGDAITDTLAIKSTIDVGLTGTPLVLTEGVPILEFFSTCASTAGGTSAEPFYLKSTMTGVGGVGGRARFHTYSNVASGGWLNALKGYMEFGASGKVSGLGSAIVAETVLSAGTSSGSYTAVEAELVLGSGASTGTATSLFYANASGAGVAAFDTSGYLLQIGVGITPAAGKFASLTSQTLKCLIEANTRYMVMSQMEDGLGLGVSGTPMDLTTSTTQRAIDVYTTSASTSGSTSIRPIYMKNTMTGAGGVGGRAEFYMTTNVALGGWSNALKGMVEYGASGKTTGLGSAIVGETILSAGTSTGTYTALEAELVLGSGASTGTETSFLYMAASGAGVAAMDTSGDLFKIDGLTVASGKLFQVNTAGAASHGLRIDIGGTKYYIMLTETGA